MIRINTQTLTFALGCLLLGASSCSRENDFQSGDKSLKVTVQMASSPMVTRGAVAPSIVSDTIDMGNDLVLVATSRPREYEQQEFLTRGKPIHSAATLPSLNVKVYNSGTASFSSSTALTATLKGTNSSGAWSLSPSYMITDGVKNTYMAYSPIEDTNNGIFVAENGRTLTYTAPTTVVNQPDLCSSAIVKDDLSGYLPLAMQHRLVAVGIKVSADNVTINEIKLNNINNSGMLNLEAGQWSGLTGSANFSPTLTTSTPSTAGAMNDITAANGYLMLPPQTFTNDNQTITVKFTYTGGTQQTATYKLKDLTGGKWEAGQIVMYEIQLKASFSLTLSTASLTLTDAAGTASFTYSTNSPSANDPQFTNNGNAWITNISVNRSTKTVTFSYKANEVSVARTATMKATSGWTEKDITVKQAAGIDPGSYIPRSVLVAAGWPANRLPTKGLQVATRGNVRPGGTPAREDPFVLWSKEYVATGITSANLGSGKGNYALLAVKDATKYPIGQTCKYLGTEWYVSSIGELELIYNNRSFLGASYSFLSNAYYGSVTEHENAYALVLDVDTGARKTLFKKNTTRMRCVREI